MSVTNWCEEDYYKNEEYNFKKYSMAIGNQIGKTKTTMVLADYLTKELYQNIFQPKARILDYNKNRSEFKD